MYSTTPDRVKHTSLKVFLCFYTFWRLLHRMEAKTISSSFLTEICDRAPNSPPLQPPFLRPLVLWWAVDIYYKKDTLLSHITFLCYSSLESHSNGPKVRYKQFSTQICTVHIHILHFVYTKDILLFWKNKTNIKMNV